LKKFQFRLQAVLDITERQKTEAGELYALQVRRLRVAEDEMKRLEDEQIKIEQELKEFSSHPSFPLDRYTLYVAYLPVLKEKQERQREEVERRVQEAETARQVLAKISKELKTLEKLRDRELEDYNLEWQREEQKQVDDSAGVNFYQKTKN
jgi:flagellar FliJ protein